MSKYAFIADVAGEFDALMRLVKKIPSDHEIIFLGDLNDRGPKSKDVIEWVKKNKKRALYGNHEDMFLQAFDPEKPDRINSILHWWFRNGGHATVQSYNEDYKLMAKHQEWIRTLPRLLRLPINFNGRLPFDEIIITHAPINPKYPDRITDQELVEDTTDYFAFEASIIWNRREPKRRDFLQISGHNSQWGYRELKDREGIYAYCLDQSQSRKLTCMLVPEMTLIEEDYELRPEIVLRPQRRDIDI